MGELISECTVLVCNKSWELGACRTAEYRIQLEILVGIKFGACMLLICLGYSLIQYRSRVLLGACAYNSTGRKYGPISEMRLITNILIMTFLEQEVRFNWNYNCFPLRMIENGRVSGRRLQRLTARTWDES